MSDNFRFYAAKMNERRHRLRSSTEPQRRQLESLFNTVAYCEARWALEERIERQP